MTTKEKDEIINQIISLLDSLTREDAAMLLLSGAVAYTKRCGPGGEELARNITNLVSTEFKRKGH